MRAPVGEKKVLAVEVELPGSVGTMVSCAYDQLTAAGVPIQKVTARDPSHADFNEITPKVLTIFSAKGLSFDSVLVPCITRQHYTHVVTQSRRMLFVACTRAVDWVCLSTVQGRETMELEQLDELVKAGQLVEQSGPSRVLVSYDNWPEEDAPF